MILDKIITQDDVEKNLFDVEKEILEQDKPNTWNVWKKGNMERVLEVDFQKFAIAVVNETGENLHKTTTFTFYATVELLKERTSKNKRNG